MADDRTYIRVHDGMDEHPKIEGLTDAAFRALHRCWYYCSRQLTDGRLTDATWKNRAKTPRVRRELVDAGLVHLPGHDCGHPDCPPVAAGHVQMHDYLDHQRSAAEVEELKAARGAGGAYGNHVRWHVKKRRHDPACEHCAGHSTSAEGSQDRSDERSPGGTGKRSQNGNGQGSDDGGQSLNHAPTEGPDSSRFPQDYRDSPSQDRSVDRSQTDRSPIADPSHSQRQRQIPTEVGGERNVSNASDPNEPPRCSKHADTPRDQVPDCWACGHKREQWETTRGADDVFQRPPWCGRCDQFTRLYETDDGMARCPTCHPLAHGEPA